MNRSAALSGTRVFTATVAALALLLGGCLASSGGTKSDSASSSTPAAKPAEPAPVAKGPKAGMNDRGEVIDPTKVEAGSGQTVKGINDWEGEITGKPVPGSKFAQLKIGMSLKQVVDLAGQPTDRGGYVTGKAFIPFFYGSDRHRVEMLYKGHGRLIFAGGSIGNYSGGNLIWIIHSANEGGYR